MYRMISWGPELDADGLATWFPPPEEAFAAMTGKVTFTLLGPPNKGVSGVVAGFGTKKIRDGRTLTKILFDRKVTPSTANKNGLMLEYYAPRQGSIKESSNKAYWNTEQNSTCIGDVPTGTLGCAALWLRGSDQRAHYAFVPMWASQAEQNGTWRVQLWAKGKAGAPDFRTFAMRSGFRWSP